MNTTSVEITAGLGGFLVLFALALAVWVLGRDMTRRLRRLDHTEARRQETDVPQTPGAAGEPEMTERSEVAASEGAAPGEDPDSGRGRSLGEDRQ